MDKEAQQDVLQAALRQAARGVGGNPEHVATHIAHSLDQLGYEIVAKRPTEATFVGKETEEVFLIGVSVTGPSAFNREQLQKWLHGRLNLPEFRSLDGVTYIDCWWVAEDDRRDGSDNSSAVFVPGDFGQGMTQHQALQLLTAAHRVFAANEATFEQVHDLINAAGVMARDDEDDEVPWVQHVDYSHVPGYLIDCRACMAKCHCTEGSARCVYEGSHFVILGEATS